MPKLTTIICDQCGKVEMNLLDEIVLTSVLFGELYFCRMICLKLWLHDYMERKV